MLVALFCFVFFIQNLTQALSPSEDEYLIRHFTAEDGLPVNAVSDITQDEDGYLWFATLNGLARYDGYEFITFNSSNSKGILSERFKGMLMTTSGDIWLPTESGPLTVYRNKTFKTYTEADGVEGQIVSLKEGDNGQIWMATSAGLRVLDPETDRFLIPHYDMLQGNTWAVEPIKNGGLLVVNERGLVHLHEKNTQLLLESEDFSIPVERTMNLKQSVDGMIWILSADGVFSFHKETETSHHFYTERQQPFIAWGVYESNSGIILNTSRGFYRIDPEDTTLQRLPIKIDSQASRPNTVITQEDETILFGDQVVLNGKPIFEADGVQTGFVDREGSIWVASVTNGLYQLRKSIVTNITSSDGRSIENIYSVIQASNGDIWAGSLLTGVYRFRENGTDFWHNGNSSLTTNQVRFLYEDSSGSVYAGLWGDGLWTFTGDDWSRIAEFDHVFDSTPQTVEAMFKAINGTLIIGTRTKTVLEHNGRFQTLEDSLGTGLEGVRVIRQAGNSPVFLGTNGHGLGILTNDGELTTVTENGGLPSNFIRDIFIQSEDTLWLATENQGLARVLLNETHKVTSIQHVSSRDGLMDNSLHRIIPDHHNNFWISSNSGVMKISRHELNSYADGDPESLSVIGYNQRDGMINQEANGGVQTAGVRTRDNKIWFPNQKGITVIDLTRADSLEQQGEIRPVLEHLALPDTTLQVANDSSVELPKGRRNFSIKFTAPNFAHPERVVYKYRLSGINETWITANQSREAAFTNLPPGGHHFEVQTSQGNGTITNASLFITIPHYFYETTWFYLLMICIACLLVVGGVKYRTRTLELREKKLQQRVDEQTEELQEAAEQKSRFFSGITHELKTPLSLILGPLDDLTENQQLHNLKNVQTRLHMMRRNGYRLQNLVDQILDVTRLNAEAIKLTLQPVEFEKLSRQIIGQFQSRLKQKKINLTIEADNIDTPVYLDREAWERIIINLVSNAIKFSPEDSVINISLKNHENDVSLSVKDHGKGIKPDDQAKVFDYLYQAEGAGAAEGTGIGLFLVKGLVEQMGGRIEVISKENEGAEFIVTLKKGCSHFPESDTVLHEPLENDGAQKQPDPIVEHSPEQAEAPSKEEKILVVEDNDDFRSYLQSILSEIYFVSTAAEGEEALEILKSETPDLIISDVMMPGMNGLEFVNSLRKKKRFTHLPVIFLSAKNHETDIETGLSTGADIYLTKPIKSKMLLAQIEAVLRRENVLKIKQINEEETDEDELIIQIRTLVYRQLANSSLNVTMLADALFISRSKLYKEWKKVSEITINDFIKQLRLREGRVLIEEKGFGIQEAARAVGYSNPDYFSTSFKKEFGVSPSDVTH